MIHKKYSIGIAKVTSKGINFRGIHYSNTQAIKERWFEIVEWTGDWPIAVIFNPKNLSRIYFVDEKKNNIILCETIIPKSEYDKYKEKLEEYFNAYKNFKENVLPVKRRG
ncbi:MAG: Mu transposase C-terminal domain-containing protein [Paenibacillus sp.]|nr:Mu transposase C-terminal domain-containing protein [Paenibacillus sp.]